MRQENIFVINFLVIKYFRYELIFHVKTANLLNEVTSLPGTPLLKLRTCYAPLFQNLAGGLTLLEERGWGVCMMM